MLLCVILHLLVYSLYILFIKVKQYKDFIVMLNKVNKFILQNAFCIFIQFIQVLCWLIK